MIKPRLNYQKKTKKIYNILSDYPETIVDYVVPRMIKNEKNDKQILWFTNRKAFGRFLTAGLKKEVSSKNRRKKHKMVRIPHSGFKMFEYTRTACIIVVELL